MNRTELLAAVNSFATAYRRPLGDYALIGASALTYLGLIDSGNDVYLQVPDDVWDTMEYKYPARVEHGVAQFSIGAYDHPVTVHVMANRYPIESVKGVTIQRVDSLEQAQWYCGNLAVAKAIRAYIASTLAFAA